ncbi:MAG: rhamnulokinase family protein [Candidatus Poribacteria bacterium]|nr:rhamnulokinase family protein [Candidatus Poribacteria bacterium]
MDKSKDFLAFDLGAESGRGILGCFDGKQIKLKVLHRFPNGGIQILDNLHWDIISLWREIKNTLSICAKNGSNIESIGVDTWGVDFGLLDKTGHLIGLPFHYRDSRTTGVLEKVFDLIPRPSIFELSGCQFMEINTIYQLYSMVLTDSPLLRFAETFLTIPDLINFWLTGQKVSEFTNATTTQLYDPRKENWSAELCQVLNIPLSIFPKVIQPGTDIGLILPSITNETALQPTRVIAPACHDTGSAVAAVPVQNESWAYISSGTWSLMGIEVEEPIITKHALDLNFTNEGGVDNTFRFLKNIMGLWLVQECRRTWSRSGEQMSYDEISQIAAQAEPFKALIDPDHHLFLASGDMPKRIVDFCKQTNQNLPLTKGEIVRSALESLALKYRWVLEKLEFVKGEAIDTIHIIGGGTQNKLLCQFTADATKRQVIAGPVEATSIGNLLVQMASCGAIGSITEGREIIAESSELIYFEPTDNAQWDQVYDRFLEIANLP